LARAELYESRAGAGSCSRDGEVRFDLVHTGQHYDANMSDVFFAISTCRSPTDFWELVPHSCRADGESDDRDGKASGEIKPYLVMVAGDVNSTLANRSRRCESGNFTWAYRSRPSVVRPLDAGGG